MKLGLYVSLTWIVSFLTVVLAFPSSLSQMGYLLGLLSIVVVGRSLRRSRSVSGWPFVTCLWVSWFTFLCVVLLTTGAQWVYFALVDDGHFFGSLLSFLSSDEVRQLYSDENGQHFLEQLQSMMVEMQSLSVKDIIMSFMFVNLMIGLVFSMLSLLFLIGAPTYPQQNQTT